MDKDQASKFVIHAVQIQHQSAYRNNEFYKFLSLQELGHVHHSFSVVEGLTLELVVAKWWASLGKTKVKYRIMFHGLAPNQKTLQIVSCCFDIFGLFVCLF